ncbi:phosphatidylserine decarboxylase [Vineibacter terrae]|uniref:Phosphatidylserine decarboxylase proenzyme n=1 Tax=Vineibacter terrae TaxID=2586908 RepID=A0A5C8PW96_9HYPH|nr:phosphatidylserine decarboxylase [Vineibacter terrae]TXL82331.1 phosphatidylserine decarboxylase [Vineibacter terrae]
MLADFLIPIHREGWRFIGIFAGATLVAALFIGPLFWPLFLLSLWCVYFFRDPPRLTPQREGLFVAPADGLVREVGPAVPPPELGLGSAPLMRVSTFLSVFDVHINRIPVDSAVEVVAYHPGKFLSAADDKASDENERMAVSLRLPDGRMAAVVQIAGLVARRIVCQLRPGQRVRAGERYGLIRFGSRTDLYLPDGVQPLVYPGQRMIGGETVIADAATADAAPRPAVEL